MRMISLVLALGMAVPTRARARSRAEGQPQPPPHTPPPSRQPRRAATRTGLLSVPPSRSPCGRHLVEVDGGAVYVDGRRVHPSSGNVVVLATPIWRGDGDAVAWLERASGETRLVVLPALSSFAEPMAWPLPRALGREQVHWAGARRVVVGPAALEPRAVASWTDG
jgi:hypothetical protein